MEERTRRESIVVRRLFLNNSKSSYGSQRVKHFPASSACHPISALTFADVNGKDILVTGDSVGELNFFDFSQSIPQKSQSPIGHTDKITCLSSWKNYILSSSYDCTMGLCDLERMGSRDLHVRFFHGEHLWRCNYSKFHPNGSLCLSSGSNFVNIWHRDVQEDLLTIITPGTAYSAQFLPGSDHDILVLSSNSIQIYDIRNHTVYPYFKVYLEQESQLNTCRNQSSIRAVEKIDPLISLNVESASSKNPISVYNKTTKLYERPFVGHKKKGSDPLIVHSAVVSDDGLLLYTSSNDHTIKLWNLYDLQGITTFEGAKLSGEQNPILSRNGKYLISPSDCGKEFLWESPFQTKTKPQATPKQNFNNPILSTKSCSSQLLCCSLNSSDTILVSGGIDGNINVHSAVYEEESDEEIDW